MPQQDKSPVSRRAFMKFVGLTGGSALMYDTMVAMGYAGTSDFNGPIKLSGDVKGASVLILGAGLAGMTAAYELRKAGYKVQLLEYNDRPGGRNWSLYGGDSYTDIGGVTQKVQFAPGLYLNPGPWRLPHHHHAILYYCKLFNVALETFTMTNYNAYIHSTKAFGGKPIRRREIDMDFSGYVAELLAKATTKDKLDVALGKDEKDGLLQILKFWGGLNKNYEYRKGPAASELRGYKVDPGGGFAPGGRRASQVARMRRGGQRWGGNDCAARRRRSGAAVSDSGDHLLPSMWPVFCMLMCQEKASPRMCGVWPPTVAQARSK